MKSKINKDIGGNYNTTFTVKNIHLLQYYSYGNWWCSVNQKTKGSLTAYTANAVSLFIPNSIAKIPQKNIYEETSISLPVDYFLKIRNCLFTEKLREKHLELPVFAANPPFYLNPCHSNYILLRTINKIQGPEILN